MPAKSINFTSKNTLSRLNTDPLMENYDEMVKYIIKHIDETK